MKKVYPVVSGLMFLAIFVQFYFAAVGAFDKPQDTESFAMHRMNGTVVIPALSVLAALVGAVARMPLKLVGLSILPAVLVLVLPPGTMPERLDPRRYKRDELIIEIGAGRRRRTSAGRPRSTEGAM